MAAVFISHSSRDDALIGDLEGWLIGQGFSDLFVDHSDIVAGSSWEDSLKKSAGAACVVLCLVTENWLTSKECPSEFKAAWYMGKRIIPLFLLDEHAALSGASVAELDRVRAEAQGVDLASFIDAEGRLDFSRDEKKAEMLRRGLRASGAVASVGLDPEAFETDVAMRPLPFPGLLSFGDEDADAAIFYGRSLEIAQTLEQLRQMRANGEPKPLIILGASGSGKSSLLKAGVIPRLRREAPAWIPMRAFRPGADPMLNFAEAITRTLADFGEKEAKGTLKQALMEAWRSAPRDNRANALAPILDDLAARLRGAANRPEGTILIALDQGEEIARSVQEEGQALADYLAASMTNKSPWKLVLTIRTDSFSELQDHPRFKDLKSTLFDLRALPLFRFDNVVEEPATRYGVQVDTALTESLMEDAPDRDSLPLLAFALQQLWDRFADSGSIKDTDYAAMGKLSGIIGDAAERALCGIEPEQRDTAMPTGGGARAHQIEAGRGAFVPALADINEDGAAIRRVADWDGFDEPAQEMLERFDRWRLVIRKQREGEAATVEVAHEALFREWDRLREWLEPERERLEASRGLAFAAASWSSKGREPELLTHFGDRLTQAEALRTHDQYSGFIGDVEDGYLSACRVNEDRRTRNSRLMRTALFLSAIGMLWLTVSSIRSADKARDEETRASSNEMLAFAALSREKFNTEEYTDSLRLALAAWPRRTDSSAKRFLGSLRTLLRVSQTHTGMLLKGHEKSINSAVFSPAGDIILTASDDNTSRLWRAKTGEQRAILEGHKGPVYSAVFSPTGDAILTASEDNTAQLWDPKTGEQRAILKGHKGPVYSAVFSPSGNAILTASGDNTAQLWDPKTGEQRAILEGHKGAVYSAVFSPSGDAILTVSVDNIARLWDPKTGEQRAILEGHKGPLYSAVFSPSGDAILTAASSDNTPRLWDPKTGEQRAILEGHKGPVYSAVFSPSGDAILTVSVDNIARLWDPKTGKQTATLQGHRGPVYKAVFSPSGDVILTASGDSTARIWDPVTREEKIRLYTEKEINLFAVNFSPLGDTVIALSGDNFPRVWKIKSVKWLNHIISATRSVSLTTETGGEPAVVRDGNEGQSKNSRHHPKDSPFRLICSLLEHHGGNDLGPLSSDYGIPMRPICDFENGYNPPIPDIWRNLEPE